MAIEHDKVAVQALLSRYTTLFYKRQADEKLRVQITERIGNYQNQLHSYRGAFALFGFSFDDKDIWDKVRNMIGSEAYDAAMIEAAVASGNEETAQQLRGKILSRLANSQPSIEAKKTAEEHSLDTVSKNGQSAEQASAATDQVNKTKLIEDDGEVGALKESSADATPRVRETVLERLKMAGDAGLRAKEIRDYYEATFGVTLHEKTVGMTLYRLSRDELVRRDGRTWFYVPPKGETKNPGVAAPGSIANGHS